MLASGLDANDYLVLMDQEKEGADWPSTAEELGDERLAHAKHEQALGHVETAKHFYFAASALYRVGQYPLVEWDDERKRIYCKLVDAFGGFVELAGPQIETVAIPYKDYRMDGWLIRPEKAAAGNPVVLMIPGATGFKEEMFPSAMFMAERGLAVLLIDGPGQGTTMYFNAGRLQLDIEDAYRVALDFIEAKGEFGNIGIHGSSTGGYYISRAAAVDKRIRAAVWNSGSYTPGEITEFAPVYRSKFALLYGVSEEEMDGIWPKMTLEGLASKIECSYLVVHSESDHIFLMEGARRAIAESPSADKELKEYKGTLHCQAGAESEAFRYMADWLADRLATFTAS